MTASTVPVDRLAAIKVVDVDTHLPHDLWTWRAPARRRVSESLAGVDDVFLDKVLSGNAVKVYSLPRPAADA